MADRRDEGYCWGGVGVVGWDVYCEEPAAVGIAGNGGDEDCAEGEDVGGCERREGGDGGWWGAGVGGELSEDAFCGGAGGGGGRGAFTCAGHLFYYVVFSRKGYVWIRLGLIVVGCVIDFSV